ncbi:MAG: B12-binding domain-containing radical SAM protein, partial [Clostridiales bacterium]
MERPGQYLGGEKNSIRKDATAVRASMAFAFPDAYEIGMSHLGLRLIYAAVNQQPDLLCERCFLPLDDLSDAMRQQGIPLFSWESRRPIATFDVIGFTLQY